MSGCDYTSFFAGYSKKRIMEAFLQYHDFITGKDKASGTLDDINVNGEGFLSFIRLVGCFHFKKHLAGFFDPSPYNLYKECSGANEKEIYEYEDNHVPSLGALKYHWLRCCWVSHYWSQEKLPNCDTFGYFAI